MWFEADREDIEVFTWYYKQFDKYVLGWIEWKSAYEFIIWDYDRAE